MDIEYEYKATSDDSYISCNRQSHSLNSRSQRQAKGVDGVEKEETMKSALVFSSACRSCSSAYTHSRVIARSKKPDSSFDKEFQKRKSSTPKPATSYRRKKVQKEELPEDTDLYRDPTMTLYYTNQGVDTAVPVLLVDGYNICGYWAKLKKHFINGRLDIARQKLIDELITFSELREVKVVVVFDAMMSGLPTHKENFAGIDIIFSAETCADSWIEKEVVALKEDGCPKVWVATSDHCHQQAAHGAGAFVWSCKAFVSEIKASKKEFERMLQEQRSYSVQGKLLKHNLCPEVVDALKDLRRKLSENESTP
ncbi:PREDICTED: uncharacterized protein LOC104593890 isoform X2 [Nelumbo nucifera]|uniref:Uncharacterized protein LOC104593890 isoform X2 n=1 Tax=Nelumbo nucifera TaxID=4432 RepID=A0A1U7ZTK6_NELNU|nr:PREDICTED: uncharacterized protein LOC104593890 isoform X2 [Nelumbo nucifera]